MNFLSCVLLVPVYCRTLVLYLMLISIINHYTLQGASSMKPEKQTNSNSYLNDSKSHSCKYIDDFGLRADCELWSCWESQLRDNTRIEFLRIYNSFRANIAYQECDNCTFEKIPVMIQLEWHWKLEQESQKKIKYCPFNDFQSNLKIDFDDGNTNETYTMKCEMVATSFLIQSGSQSELVQMLHLLLRNNSLYDFNESNAYRRHLAMYIGCSYVPRVLDSKQIHSANDIMKDSIGHLLCFYCTKEKTMYLGDKTQHACPHYTSRNKTNEFPGLCKSLEDQVILPCESKAIPCAPWKRSYSWMVPFTKDMILQFDNETKLFSTNLNNFNTRALALTESSAQNAAIPPIIVKLFPHIIRLDPYDKKFCILMVLIYILILVLMTSTIMLVYCFYVMGKSRIRTQVLSTTPK